MQIGELTAVLGIDSSPLRRAEGDLRSFGATADNQFSSVIRKAAALAASLLTVSVAIKAISDAATTGMKLETLTSVTNTIGKNMGFSADAVKYFVQEVKSAGVTTTEAMAGIGKAMALGLDLNRMKEFTTRVRDVAVGARDAAGNILNTSETFAKSMLGIASGNVEHFRTIGIVAFRDSEVVLKEYGMSIGLAGKELVNLKSKLNQAQISTAMLNEYMRASVPLAGAAASADETVGKQLASMARYSEDAKAALWDLFKPGMEAGVVAFTTAFKDLKKWADDNNTSLKQTGIQIGIFIGQVGVVVLDTIKWISVNLELIKSLAEFYIIYKIVGWAVALKNALVALYATMMAGEVAAATVRVINYGSALGGVAGMARVAQVQVAAAGGAAASSGTMAYGAVAGWMALGKAIVIAGAAFLVYKTFSKPDMSVEAGPGSHAVISGLGAAPAPEPAKRGPLASPAFVQAQQMQQLQQKYTEEATANHLKKLQEQMNKGGGGGGGKGGGADGEINRLNSLFDTLTKDIARLSEGKLSAIEADYVKTVENIYKKTSDRAHSEAEVEILAKTRATLQKGKLQDDFDLKMAKGSGDAFLEINEQYQNDLQDYNGLAGAKEKLDAYYGRQRVIKEVERGAEVMNLEKQTLDTMAGLTPMLQDQLVLKRKSLDIENDLAQAAITKLMAEKPYLSHLEDELRLRQAVLAQAKKYTLEMENNKGLQGWAYGRAKEADSRNSVKGMMGELESGFQSAFSSGLQGVLSKDKNTLKDIGKTMWQGLLGEIAKKSTTKMFDGLAKMLSKSGPKGSGGDSADGLSQAAEGLNQASLGFNANTLEFGLAAGGLLLSGIGIATNSQFLVYAGMVLQIAGLAIQVIQALVGATQMSAAAALIGAAGALTAAAVALKLAAIASSVPFFHSGGLVAHSGLLVAHGGLNIDERIVRVQTGEGIIKRGTMAAYAQQGISFDDLNNGRLPIITAPYDSRPSGSGNGGGSVTVGGITVHINNPPKDFDANKLAKKLVPALQKQIKLNRLRTA